MINPMTKAVAKEAAVFTGAFMITSEVVGATIGGIKGAVKYVAEEDLLGRGINHIKTNHQIRKEKLIAKKEEHKEKVEKRREDRKAAIEQKKEERMLKKQKKHSDN